MKREIGSEFWILESELGGNKEIPQWLSRFGNIILTTSGRGALSLLLNNISPQNKKVLLPSYICDSVILPFEMAGYELAYYQVSKRLEPIDIQSIESTDAGVFLHLGYFGFSTNEDLTDTIINLRSKSVIIVEDATHTLFTVAQKQLENDYVIGSIRKWFGIPSGGFLASNKSMNFELGDSDFEFTNLRRDALYRKSEYMKYGYLSIKSLYLSEFGKAEKILDKDFKPYKIDPESEMIIKNLNSEQLQILRKKNYEYLLDNLSNIDGIEVIFNNVETNNIPMFFPIYIKHNRNELRKRLVEKGIFCPVHWPVSKKLSESLSNVTKEIYCSILSIPCDQRYDEEDMYRIICEIQDYLKCGEILC